MPKISMTFKNAGAVENKTEEFDGYRVETEVTEEGARLSVASDEATDADLKRLLNKYFFGVICKRWRGALNGPFVKDPK